MEGTNVTLNCFASGNPLPNVAWIRGSNNSVITNSRTLLLADIKRTESGLFHCLAWNGVGANATTNVNVDVLCEYFRKEEKL